MKVIITNAYTWFNKGDAGILLGIVDCFKEIYNDDVEFTILSFTPDEDKKRYCKDNHIKNVYSNVLNPHPYKHTKIGRTLAILKLFFSMLYQFLQCQLNMARLVKKNDNYRALYEADLIVVCGGGFLGGKKFDSIIHLFQIYVNTLFQKKVILMGTSIEPVNNEFINKLTQRILKKTDYIFAREIYTYNYLKKFMNKDKITLAPDMAFMLNELYEKDNKIVQYKNEGKKVYGITVRNWNFPNDDCPMEKMKNYLETIAKLIYENTKNDKAVFVFVPQVIVEYGNDVDVANKIKKLLPKKVQKNFIILTDDLSPIQIKTLIGNFDFFIGTRMHSNIFAISVRVPTLAIAYEKKTNGIMHMVGLDDYVVEMGEISYQRLTSILELMEENEDEIRKKLEEKVPVLKQEILEKVKKVQK